MNPTTDGWVIDASVAVKWELTDNEEDVEQARLLLSRFAQGEVALVAPQQIIYEVPSAIAVATLGREARLTQQGGEEAINDFLSIGLPTISDNELIIEAYRLVYQHDIAFYDALYLALAQRLKYRFITSDNRLYARVNQLPEVVWLGNYD